MAQKSLNEKFNIRNISMLSLLTMIRSFLSHRIGTEYLFLHLETRCDLNNENEIMWNQKYSVLTYLPFRISRVRIEHH